MGTYSTTEEFIQKAKKLHDNKYNYSKVNYKHSKEKICIICLEHGEFWQTPNDHLKIKKCGCQKCGYLNKIYPQQKTTEFFITEAKKIYGNKYDYSKVEYKGTHNKICIICPKHGEFYPQPSNFLRGTRCPKCQESKGEKVIETYLKENNIQYETQKRFEACKYKRSLPFDFYLSSYNICIEYDGEQHFKSKSCFGGNQRFQRTQLHDQIKNQYCQDNNIKLIRIPYTEFKNINQILKDYIFTNV